MTCPCMRYEPDPGLCGVESAPPCPADWTHGSHCRCAHFPAEIRAQAERSTRRGRGPIPLPEESA